MSVVSQENPEEYILYLPKKSRKSLVPGGSLGLIKETNPEFYNDMTQEFKEYPPTGMVYVDIYKNNIIYFECSKAIEVVKKYTFEKYGLHIVIKMVVIADIKSFVASYYSEGLLYEPSGKNGDENYPSSILFDEAM